MTAKINDALADLDKLCEDIHTADFKPDAKAEFARLQERANYLRSDAYHLRLSLSSSIIASVIAVAIIFGVNYFMASVGISSPAKLHKALYSSLGIVALHLIYAMWKIWRKSGNRAA